LAPLVGKPLLKILLEFLGDSAETKTGCPALSGNVTCEFVAGGQANPSQRLIVLDAEFINSLGVERRAFEECMEQERERFRCAPAGAMHGGKGPNTCSDCL
jgi:hypothetical protein